MIDGSMAAERLLPPAAPVCHYAGLSPWCAGRAEGEDLDGVCEPCRQARGTRSHEEFLKHISLWELLQALVPPRRATSRTRFYRPLLLA